MIPPDARIPFFWKYGISPVPGHYFPYHISEEHYIIFLVCATPFNEEKSGLCLKKPTDRHVLGETAHSSLRKSSGS